VNRCRLVALTRLLVTFVGATPVVASHAQAAEPEVRTYIVQPGDSVWSIAAEFFGSGDKYPIIYKYNDFVAKPPLIAGEAGTWEAAWEPAARTETYRVELATDATFNQVLFDAEVGAGVMRLRLADLLPGAYAVRISTRDADKFESRPGGPRLIEVVALKPLRALASGPDGTLEAVGFLQLQIGPQMREGMTFAIDDGPAQSGREPIRLTQPGRHSKRLAAQGATTVVNVDILARKVALVVTGEPHVERSPGALGLALDGELALGERDESGLAARFVAQDVRLAEGSDPQSRPQDLSLAARVVLGDAHTMVTTYLRVALPIGAGHEERVVGVEPGAQFRLDAGELVLDARLALLVLPGVSDGSALRADALLAVLRHPTAVVALGLAGDTRVDLGFGDDAWKHLVGLGVDLHVGDVSLGSGLGAATRDELGVVIGRIVVDIGFPP